MAVYCYPRPKKGLALIVNNSLKDNRADISNLSKMFKAIDYEIMHHYSGSSSSETTDIYEHLKTLDLSEYNVLFLVVFSDVQTGGKICALSKDNLEIERLLESLAGNSTMVGQPKVAFIGSSIYDGDGAADGRPQTKNDETTSLADIFLLNVVLKSYNTTDASVFIEVFCRRVRESFQEKPFIDLVQEAAVEAQLSQWRLIYSSDKVLSLTKGNLVLQSRSSLSWSRSALVVGTHLGLRLQN